MNVGPGKIISSVTHKGTDLTQADTKADQTYNYDSATGVLTIYNKSFSQFAVTDSDYKDYDKDNKKDNDCKKCDKKDNKKNEDYKDYDKKDDKKYGDYKY